MFLFSGWRKGFLNLEVAAHGKIKGSLLLGFAVLCSEESSHRRTRACVYACEYKGACVFIIFHRKRSERRPHLRERNKKALDLFQFVLVLLPF